MSAFVSLVKTKKMAPFGAIFFLVCLFVLRNGDIGKQIFTTKARRGNEGVDMPSTARLDIFAENAAKSICFRDAKARYDTYVLTV